MKRVLSVLITYLFVISTTTTTTTTANAEPVEIDVKELEGLMSAIEALSHKVETLEAEISLYESDAIQEQADAVSALRSDRHLTESASESPASVQFEHPDARMSFYRGSSISETSDTMTMTPSLKVWPHLHTGGNLTVKGSLRVGRSNLNLGLPLEAAEAVSAGDVVSLAPSGGVSKGFGMQVSSSLTALEIVAAPVVARLTDSAMAIAYLDEMSRLQLVYYDALSSATESPISVAESAVVETFTMTAVSEETVVVCYRKSSDVDGFCRGAVYTTGFNLGTEVKLETGGTYFSGSLTSLHGASDRAVLLYSMATDPLDVRTESTRAQVLAISGTGVSKLELPRSLMSTKTDHLAAVSISSLRVIVAYRVVRDANTEVRELYFRPEDPVNLQTHSRFALSSSGADLQYMSLDRLTDTSAILVFRDGGRQNEIRALIIDGASEPLLHLSAETVVDSGAVLPASHLMLSATAVSSDRVGVVYIDAAGLAQFVDTGLFGQSVVVGRPQPLEVGGGTTETVTAVAIAASTAIVLSQPTTGGSSDRGAAVRRAVLFGGPTMLGLAANDAGPGESVTVVFEGALDAYSDLRPGAPYYARYDGGIADSPDALSGASDAIVGKGLTPTTMVSLVGSDGETNKATISSLRKDTDVFKTDLQTRILPLHNAYEDTFAGEFVFHPEYPIFRWAMWSTYAQNHGWYASNRADLFGGQHPSCWGDGNCKASDMSNNKRDWISLFNKKMYPGWNAVVCADEWQYYSSTNSKHCGALFRIRNTKTTTVRWPMYWYYSAYSGWSEQASITLNGANLWNTGSSCGGNCNVHVDVDVPPGRISTVIVISSSGDTSSTRSTVLAFYNDCLKLPEGLEYVDDMYLNQENGWSD